MTEEPFFMIFGWMECQAAAPSAEAPVQPKIEATLIYDFLKYTSWPKPDSGGAKSGLKVCIMGNDAADKYIYPLQNQTAQRLTIGIMQIDTLLDKDGCDMLLIHQGQERAVADALKAIKGKPILTVSDMEGFSEVGGMVEMLMGKDGRLHLYVSRDALAAAKLNVNPRLINLSELGRS